MISGDIEEQITILVTWVYLRGHLILLGMIAISKNLRFLTAEHPFGQNNNSWLLLHQKR